MMYTPLVIYLYFLMSCVFFMNISTQAQAENTDTALVINSITKHNESNGIRCNPIFAEYQTGISGIQNIATVRMTFLDSWNISSGYVIYRIKLVVYSAKIEGIHLVTVETSNQIVKQKIKMNSSLVFKTQTETFSLNFIKYQTKTTHHAFALQYWRTHHPCY